MHTYLRNENHCTDKLKSYELLTVVSKIWPWKLTDLNSLNNLRPCTQLSSSETVLQQCQQTSRKDEFPQIIFCALMIVPENVLKHELSICALLDMFSKQITRPSTSSRTAPWVAILIYLFKESSLTMAPPNLPTVEYYFWRQLFVVSLTKFSEICLPVTKSSFTTVCCAAPAINQLEIGIGIDRFQSAQVINAIDQWKFKLKNVINVIDKSHESSLIKRLTRYQATTVKNRGLDKMFRLYWAILPPFKKTQKDLKFFTNMKMNC